MRKLLPHIFDKMETALCIPPHFPTLSRKKATHCGGFFAFFTPFAACTFHKFVSLPTQNSTSERENGQRFSRAERKHTLCFRQ